MLNNIAAFLQERSSTSSTIYGYFFIPYFALLIALSVLLIVRFKWRGWLMLGLMLVYALTNLTADSLSESVAKFRMASNNSVVRLFLVVCWFGVLFSCLMTGLSWMGKRK